jgi:hypothetical protein
LKKQKDVVINCYDSNAIEAIRNLKDTTIYIWKHAIRTWDDTDEFVKMLETNNISVVYFEDKKNYLSKKQWVISDEDGRYWSGKWAQHPFGGRSRLFLQYKCYAKKYFSKKVAERSAEIMENNGVFGQPAKYLIEEI